MSAYVIVDALTNKYWNGERFANKEYACLFSRDRAEELAQSLTAEFPGARPCTRAFVA